MNTAFLVALSWLVLPAAAGPLGDTISRDVPVVPRRVGFHDAVSTHAIPMRKHNLAPSETHPSLHRRANTPARLKNIYDVYYSIDLEVGNQTIAVSVDTGSSDTWMVHEPYQCVSFWFEPSGAASCGLGSGFQGDLSGGTIPDLPPFVRSYVDGTFVQGYYGRENVTIGGITAQNQRLALVNYTYWHGDGQTSGLLGLAYPYLTSLDGPDQNQPAYDPVFTTMWKSGAIDPLFSIALSRHQDQGNNTESVPGSGTQEESYLALGGLPPVEIDEKTWARTPIHGMKAIPQWGFETDERGMYIVKPDAFVLEQGGTGPDAGKELVRNTTQIPILIDVGATLSYLPKSLINQLYAAFDPPAKYMSNGGLFYALCNATVPRFGVQIEDSIFYMAPEDLLRQTARDPTGEWCRIGVTDTDTPPHVLGVSFLTNVVAVFDVGKSEMRFAARNKY